MTEPTTPTNPAVRTFLVDDHSMFRAGVRAELHNAGAGRVDIVGEAGTVAEALAWIGETSPDVVLLDVHMPDGGGLAVLRQTLEGRAGGVVPQFLCLSVSDAAEDVIALIRGGARGYVTKSISGAELVDAITRVHTGDAVFSPRLAGYVLDAFSSPAPSSSSSPLPDATSPRPTAGTSRDASSSSSAGTHGTSANAATNSQAIGPHGAYIDRGPANAEELQSRGVPAEEVAEVQEGANLLEDLTRREREVLKLLARGYTYREMAEKLFISVKTVETHVSNILRKTQHTNRHSLSRWVSDQNF